MISKYIIFVTCLTKTYTSKWEPFLDLRLRHELTDVFIFMLNRYLVGRRLVNYNHRNENAQTT